MSKPGNIIKAINYKTPFYLFFIILTYFVSDNIFFWDTIQLGSKQAHVFYENNFYSLLLPDIIDSGHIPGFGAYIALVWMIFGKSLIVSHFAMLPFLLGIVFMADKLISNYIDKKYRIFVLILFLADPTLLGQATLISPDIILIFSFLGALNNVISKNNILKSVFITTLFLISMRGMMTAFAVLLFDLTINIKKENIKGIIIQLLKKSIAYIPALLIFIGYAIYHYQNKKWFAYHENSPWAENFKYTDTKGFFKNIIILTWRILDFGRIFLWVPAIFLFIKYFKKAIKNTKAKQILLIFIYITISLLYSFLAYKSLNGHRYILPFLLIFSLFAGFLIFNYINKEKIKFFLFAIILAGLLSGNLWIYPEKIAQGWDSSLAQLNYFKLRKNMMAYMQKEDINISETACVFPNTAKIKYMELNNDSSAFANKNLNENKYILYSNIYNDYTDNDIGKINKDFILIKKYTSLGVFIKLYKSRK